MKKYLCVLLCLWPLLGGFRSAQPEGHKPKNIILMIGDGMGISQLTAGLVVNGGDLELSRCKHIGLSKTFSYDDLITDSAAGATAFACGEKTYNGALAVHPFSNKKLPTILEVAHGKGLSTGIVATSYIQHATPAAFYAHRTNRSMYEDITLDFMDEEVDIAIGGGRRFFEKRKDGKALLDTLQAHGYEYFTKVNKARKKALGNKILVLQDDDHLPSVEAGRGRFLQIAAEFAAERLNQNEKGFFMMIEGSQIDWGGHANDKDYIVDEVLDFNRTIGKIFDFAEEDGNTLVIITADHETGGFAVEGGSLEDRVVVGDFTTGGHSAAMVPVFAFGPGAEAFGGIYDNTEIYKKMMAAYGWK
ncbi:MAG: alkaline phosphatase [Bacteroidia bacterium]